MTQIDDILYSPISLLPDWKHLWADLDNTNRIIVKAVLGNLRYQYDTFRYRYPDRNVVDFTAKLTAYVMPRLIANHIVSVQSMAAVSSMVARLEYDDHKLQLKTHVVDSHLRNTCARIFLNDKDYHSHLTELGDEIITEFDQNLLRVVRSLPDTPTAQNTFDISSPPIPTVSDEFAALVVMMHRESSRIANNTRRARGNRAIISPAALRVLEAGSPRAFLRDPEHKFYNVPALPEKVKYCGLFGNDMQVFVDECADDETPILIAYKGESAIDGGMIWAPYVPLDPIGRVVDPNTFELIQPFKTNHGCLIRTPIDDSDKINASANWFGLVGFNMNIMGWL